MFIPLCGRLVMHSRLGGKVQSLLPKEVEEPLGNLPLLVPQLRERRHELRLDAIPLVLRSDYSTVLVRHTVAVNFVALG